MNAPSIGQDTGITVEEKNITLLQPRRYKIVCLYILPASQIIADIRNIPFAQVVVVGSSLLFPADPAKDQDQVMPASCRMLQVGLDKGPKHGYAKRHPDQMNDGQLIFSCFCGHGFRAIMM